MDATEEATMREVLLGGLVVLMATACSSGSGGGGGGTAGGGGSGGNAGGGSAGGGGTSTTCSGTPQAPVLASCSEDLSGTTLLLCQNFTGSAFTASTEQQACSLSTEKLASSPCPTSGVVGGFCIHECGSTSEFVSYIYDSSLDPRSECQQANGYYVE